MAINAAGAVCTAVTLVVVLVSKFVEGAWVMILLIPALLASVAGVRAHYRTVAREVATTAPLDASDLEPPVVLLPIRGWSGITRKALRFALKISPEVYALHIADDETDDGATWKTPGRSACASRRRRPACRPRS